MPRLDHDDTNIPRDAYGHEILPGRDVAFNLSGDVVLGRVTSSSGCLVAPWGHPKDDIRITLIRPAAGHPRGHVSRVRSRRGIVVLPERTVSR